MSKERIDELEERIGWCETWLKVHGERINTAMDAITGRLQKKYSKSPHKEAFEKFKKMLGTK